MHEGTEKDVLKYSTINFLSFKITSLAHLNVLILPQEAIFSSKYQFSSPGVLDIYLVYVKDAGDNN